MLGSPIIVVVEAKRSDFIEGWGQCLAGLVAAQKINDDNAIPVYGIVTDGALWEFGKIRGESVYAERNSPRDKRFKEGVRGNWILNARKFAPNFRSECPNRLNSDQSIIVSIP